MENKIKTVGPPILVPEDRQEEPAAQNPDTLQLTSMTPSTAVAVPQGPHAVDPMPTAEFPNFFHTNDPVKAARIQAKVTEAMASVLRRLDLPYVLKTGQISRNGFFEELEKKIRALDPDAKVYISGGVVRSILGYIYKKIYNEHQRQSTEDTTENVLNRIIQGASRKPILDALFEIFPVDQDLPKLSALGIGSDLDVSVDFSGGCTPDKREEIKQITKQFIESATDQLMPQADKTSVLTRSVLPVGDVVERKAQLERSMGQGGSPLDWLAFPVSSASGTQFVEGVPGTLGRFLKGEIEYVSPEHADNRDEQCIRMLRPLLELPFLKPSTKGAQILIQELELILAKLNKKIPLEGERPLKEFAKMLRNARFEAAHNRFSVPREGDPIGRLVHQISMSAPRGEKDLPLVPEFTQNRKIDTRNVNNHSIDRFLMNPTEFRQNYTDNGSLYHGTPKLEYVLTMIRNGLIASIPGKQGTAALGAGTYTAQERSTSAKYVGSEGTVLELKVSLSDHLRVLDLPRFMNEQAVLYQSLEKEAKQNDIDINQYLARKFDLDIIINEYPLIMNAAAIRLPKKINELIRAKLQSAFSVRERLVARDLLKTLQELRSFEQLGAVLGLKDLPSLPSDLEIHRQIADCLKDSDVPVRRAAIGLLGTIKPTVPDIHKQIADCLKDSDVLVRRAAIDLLHTIKPTDPEIHKQIVGYLTHSDVFVRRAAIDLLGTIKPTDPEIHKPIAACLTDSDANVRRAAIDLLGTIKPTDPEIHKPIAACLTDSDANVRRAAIKTLAAIKALDAIKSTNVEIQREIANCLTDLKANACKAAIKFLAASKPEDVTIQGKIAQCLTNLDANVRNAAIEFLGAIQPTNLEILAQIAAYLEYPNPDVGRAAIRVFEAINPTDSMIQQITARLTDPDAKVHEAAIVVLEAIDPTDPEVQKQMDAYRQKNPIESDLE